VCAGHLAVLQVIAHAAICGSAQAAQLDDLTAGGERRDGERIDEVLAWVENHFAVVVDQLHTELQARMRAALRPRPPPGAAQRACTSSSRVRAPDQPGVTVREGYTNASGYLSFKNK
jgi:hypothetical protein